MSKRRNYPYFPDQQFEWREYFIILVFKDQHSPSKSWKLFWWLHLLREIVAFIEVDDDTCTKPLCVRNKLYLHLGKLTGTQLWIPSLPRYKWDLCLAQLKRLARSTRRSVKSSYRKSNQSKVIQRAHSLKHLPYSSTTPTTYLHNVNLRI